MYWLVNSAPTQGLSIDETFITVLDRNDDGRISPQDILETVDELCQGLVDLTGCIEQKDTIALSNFRTDTAFGRHLHEIATVILTNLQLERDLIALADIRARSEILKLGAMNGDGVLSCKAVAQNEQKEFVSLGISLFGGCEDINGERGINLNDVNRVLPVLREWKKWRDRSRKRERKRQRRAMREGIC